MTVESNKRVYSLYRDAVRKEIPDFDTLNYDPDFLNWLRTTEAPFQKRTYGELLNAANIEYDFKNAVDIFNAYKASRAPARITEAQLQASAKEFARNPTPENEAKHDNLVARYQSQGG